jgi:uncharacterized membrane protein
MDWRRWLRHAFATRSGMRRAFPQETLDAIEAAIDESERTHTGEIRFAIEAALEPAQARSGRSPRDRALEVFATLGVWDTEANNGVLVYVLLADRDVEIVADRGIHAHVGPEGWERICQAMEAAFRRGDFEGGVIGGIRAVSEHLQRHYPGSGRARNELPDQPAVL